MIIKILAASLSFLFSITTTPVQAQGNVLAGKAKAASCASCHGEDGNSMVSTFPKLAGQHIGYLIQQIRAIQDNSRNSPMMAPLVIDLDQESIEDIAAYFASMRTSKNDLPVLDFDDEDESEKSADEKSSELNDLIALGGDLYRNGDLKRKVSACIACHGLSAEGNKPASFPSLRSQHADYLIKALTDFKKGARSNVADNMMHMIAKKMTDKEIRAVSYYISMKK